MGKQQKTDAKENDHGRYWDKPERDKVKQDADIGLQRLGALIRGIGAVLLEQNDEWQLQHRYMQVEAMAELGTAAGASDARQIPSAA